MTDWEIFRAAVVKANENLPEDSKILYTMAHQMDYKLTKGKGTPKPMLFSYIIFSPIFAKSFWGENDTCNHGVDISDPPNAECSCAWEGGFRQEAWKFHLQQMVLAEDKFQYLKKFL